ncbi:MAG: hypothetical protein ABIW17_10345 [Marmoricola sp.]
MHTSISGEPHEPLESYGRKDIWKLYVHDQREVLAPSTGAALKAEERALLKMSKQVADDLGVKSARPRRM